MGTRKHDKSRKTRSKRGGVINNNIKLIRSSMFGNREAVKKLLKEGADVNAKNSDGYTALILASSNGHTEIMKMLLEKEYKADVNATDNNDWTALHWASWNGYPEIVTMLLEKGANVNATDDDGWTPLILASEKGDREVVAMLLNARADVNATDVDNDTALMKVLNICDSDDDRPWYQVENNIIEIMQMLLDAGADVNVVNDDDETALDIAKKNGCTQRIQKPIIKHKIASIIPKGLERQEERRQQLIDRKNLNRAMAQVHVEKPYGRPRFPPELRKVMGENLYKKPNDKSPATLGGKRKTSRAKKSNRKTRKSKK